jgi:chromosome partitioning protein
LRSSILSEDIPQDGPLQWGRLITDYQPGTRIASHIEGEVTKYGLIPLATKLTRLVAFKEMTFTGEVPRTGQAGALVGELIAELKGMGPLSFLQ